MVPVVHNYNNVNIFSDYNSDESKDDIENNEDKFFDEDIDDQVKATPQTTIKTKVVGAMKKLKALYNNNANKNVKQATQEKSVVKNLNFLINLAMATNDTTPVLEEPKTFSKASDHPNANSCAEW